MFPKTRIGKTARAWAHASLAAFVLAAALPTWAAVTVQALVDRNEMEPGDTFTLTVGVSADESVNLSHPQLPPMQGLEIINQWTSEEARTSFVMGPQGRQMKYLRTQNFNYMMQATAPGDLKIGSIEVVVDGKSYNTKPIQLRVAKGASGAAKRPAPQGAPGGQPPPGLFDDEDDLFTQLLRRHGVQPPQGYQDKPINPNEAFFIQVEVDKREAYVGEQVTASWYLLTRGQIRDLDTLKYPSLRGFWKEDIEIATHLNFVQEVINGIPYKKALLASYALFPIKEGEAVIDPYTAKCTVVPMTDPFGTFGVGKAYQFTKSSQPIKIKVKQVPPEGRPKDFTGAVGQFQVTARVEDNNIVSHQPFSFRVRFEGKGNAKLIDIPPFEVPEGVELYDTQKEAKFFRTGTSYKDFTFLLIPRREGELLIPSVSASIFDPETKQYVTKATEPLRLMVGKGQGGAQGSSSPLSLGGKDDGKKTEKAFEPAIAKGWEPYRPWSASRQALGFGGMFGAVALTLLWRARVELGWGQRKKDLSRRLRARMSRVQERIDKGDWRGVGVEMTNTVYFVLGEISGQGGANEELEKLMMKAPPSVRRELAQPVQKLMAAFEVLSFAPEEVVGKLKDKSELKRLTREMQELLEKAVALGLSDERSDGSAGGPRAS